MQYCIKSDNNYSVKLFFCKLVATQNIYCDISVAYFRWRSILKRLEREKYFPLAAFYNNWSGILEDVIWKLL